jgi:hypothetical protein
MGPDTSVLGVSDVPFGWSGELAQTAHPTKPTARINGSRSRTSADVARTGDRAHARPGDANVPTETIEVWTETPDGTGEESTLEKRRVMGRHVVTIEESWAPGYAVFNGLRGMTIVCRADGQLASWPAETVSSAISRAFGLEDESRARLLLQCAPPSDPIQLRDLQIRASLDPGRVRAYRLDRTSATDWDI